jgi:hypothetical protein
LRKKPLGQWEQYEYAVDKHLAAIRSILMMMRPTTGINRALNASHIFIHLCDNGARDVAAERRSFCLADSCRLQNCLISLKSVDFEALGVDNGS